MQVLGPPSEKPSFPLQPRMENTMPTPATLPAIKKGRLYSGFVNRLVSFLVDSTIIVFLYSLILYTAADETLKVLSWRTLIEDGYISLGEAAFLINALLYNPYFFVLHWFYYTLSESSPKQATIGKFTLGMKVTDLRGKRINFLQANLRYFLKLLSALPLFLGYALLQSTRRKQTLHDYIARTLVLNDSYSK